MYLNGIVRYFKYKHFKALCIDCIPQHTESHNRNRTQPVLKKFDQAKLECAEKCTLLKE